MKRIGLFSLFTALTLGACQTPGSMASAPQDSADFYVLRKSQTRPVRSSKGKGKPSPSPTPSVTPTPVPSATPTPLPSATPTPVASPTSAPPTMVQAILDLTNQERQAAGLNTLTLATQLNQAAQSHAEDMATYNYFSHTGRDGSSPGTRITATGYLWRTYGENIAYGYASAESVMQGWMNSTGHRANILNANFTQLGVGYSKDSNGRTYYVQVFATPR